MKTHKLETIRQAAIRAKSAQDFEEAMDLACIICDEADEDSKVYKRAVNLINTLSDLV